MAVVALKPRRGYSFTDHAVANPAAPPPGDRLDGEVDRIDRALAQIIDWVSVSLNSDGTLKVAPAAAKPKETAAVGVLGGNETHSIPGADPNALAMDWAEVSAEWAEHMPDTIPPNILAVMGVTGDHWSARWWANRAAQVVAAKAGAAIAFIGADPPPSPVLGTLWWDNVGGNLYVFYDDFSSQQWTAATNQPMTRSTQTPAGQPAHIIAPASGDIVTLSVVEPVYVNNPAVLASLTLRLPPGVLGDVVEIGFANPVTALTLQTNPGAPIPSAPTSAYGPGAAIQMRFDTPGWIYWK
jgi:hypothetical protein